MRYQPLFWLGTALFSCTKCNKYCTNRGIFHQKNTTCAYNFVHKKKKKYQLTSISQGGTYIMRAVWWYFKKIKSDSYMYRYRYCTSKYIVTIRLGKKQKQSVLSTSKNWWCYGNNHHNQDPSLNGSIAMHINNSIML